MEALTEPGASVVHIFNGQVATGANWRPIRLKQHLPPYLVCSLCGIVPHRGTLLSCSHAFCDSCHSGIVGDNSSKCPLDEQLINDAFCQKISFTAKDAAKLEALCWNDGCDFVGNIKDVLQHYEKECEYHTSPCPSCQQVVLHRDIVSHYAGGCIERQHSRSSSSSLNVPCASGADNNIQPNLTLEALCTITRQMNELLELNKTSDTARLEDFSRAVTTFQNSCLDFMENAKESISSMVAERVNAGLEEVKTLIRDQCSDKLSAVQSEVSEIVEHSRQRNAPRSKAARLEEVVSALKDSECKLKEDMSRVEATLSSRLTEKLESLQRSIDSERLNACLEELKTLIKDQRIYDLPAVQSQVNKLVENSRQHDSARLEAVVRALTDSECQLKESCRKMSRIEANLSSRFTETLQSLGISTDLQQLNARLEAVYALITQQCINILLAVQSQVNELVRGRKQHYAPQLQAMARALRDSQCRRQDLSRVEANLSSRLTETLQSLQTSADSQRLNAVLEELKIVIRDLCSEPLSTVQSRMNELVVLLGKRDGPQKHEMAQALELSVGVLKKKMDTLLEDMISALRDSESKIKEDVSRVEANISSSLTGTLQSKKKPKRQKAGLKKPGALVRHQRSDPLSSIQSPVGELDAQIKQFPATLSDRIGKKRNRRQLKKARIREYKAQAQLRGSENEQREQVDRVEGNHSSRLQNTAQPLQRSRDSLPLNDQFSQTESVSAVVSSNETEVTRFGTEERLTLRKLESFATAAASTLELLRQKISQDHGEPWVSSVYELHPCRRLSNNSAVFSVHITLNSAQKEPSDLAGWNQWVYRDIYMKLCFRADSNAFHLHVDFSDFSGSSRKNQLAL